MYYNQKDDEMNIWFNELDEKTIDITNPNLIIEENSSDIPKTNFCNKCERNFIESHDDMSTYDDFTNINGVEQIFIEDIIKKDPNDLKAVQIIQYEYSLVQFIRGLIDGCHPNKIKTYQSRISCL